MISRHFIRTGSSLYLGQILLYLLVVVEVEVILGEVVAKVLVAVALVFLEQIRPL